MVTVVVAACRTGLCWEEERRRFVFQASFTTIEVLQGEGGRFVRLRSWYGGENNVDDEGRIKDRNVIERLQQY